MLIFKTLHELRDEANGLKKGLAFSLAAEKELIQKLDSVHKDFEALHRDFLEFISVNRSFLTTLTTYTTETLKLKLAQDVARKEKEEFRKPTAKDLVF